MPSRDDDVCGSVPRGVRQLYALWDPWFERPVEQNVGVRRLFAGARRRAPDARDSSVMRPCALRVSMRAWLRGPATGSLAAFDAVSCAGRHASPLPRFSSWNSSRL
jgi:hypothetical protein